MALPIKKHIFQGQHFTRVTKNKPQFEIECRCGGHSFTKKFMTILKILVPKPKLW